MSNEKKSTKISNYWAYVQKMHQKGISAFESTGDKIIYMDDLPDNPKYNSPAVISIMMNE